MGKANRVGGRTIHERLRFARESTGLSYTEAAGECTGVSAQAIRDYEGPRVVMPGASAIVQLCHVYGITADWLLGLPPVRQR